MLKELLEECILQLNQIRYYPQITDIRLNNRLSRAYGRYIPDEKIIEINQKIYKNASTEQLKTIIIHELSHNLDHLLNGQISYDLQGHGSSWQEIADDISEKLGIEVQRHSSFVVVQERDTGYFHTYKCRFCNIDKTVESKFKEKEKVRIGKCPYCKHKDWEYLFAGQWGFDAKTMKRIKILNKGD